MPRSTGGGYRPALSLFELPRNLDGTYHKGYMKSWLHRMGDWMIPEGRRVYTGEPGDPHPQRGDIVMWNDNAEHVTVATGRTGADGSPEVYPFWCAPK